LGSSFTDSITVCAHYAIFVVLAIVHAAGVDAEFVRVPEPAAGGPGDHRCARSLVEPWNLG
jgi:hypothetical protein